MVEPLIDQIFIQRHGRCRLTVTVKQWQNRPLLVNLQETSIYLLLLNEQKRDTIASTKLHLCLKDECTWLKIMMLFMNRTKQGSFCQTYISFVNWHKGCICRLILNTPGLPKGESGFGLSSLRLTMPKFAEAGNALPGSCLLITQAGSWSCWAILHLLNMLLNPAFCNWVL